MTRPKKVLHIMNAAAGGSALATVEMVRELRRYGIESCAVCHNLGSAEEREAVLDAFQQQVLFTSLYWWNRKTRVPIWRRPFSELKQLLITRWRRKSVREVVNFCRSSGADLIHTSTILNPEGALAASRLDLPHVWHVRELIGSGMPFRFYGERGLFSRFVTRHSDIVIANSQATLRALERILDAERLTLVYDGIDVGRYSDCVRQSRDQLVIGMVASLTSPVKKHATFIDAAARVDRNLPITFRIYGDDPSHGGQTSVNSYVDGLHSRIRESGLVGRFEFPGFISDTRAIMSEIDILVHPANQESFGRVAVEAMAAGIPVIGVKGGGVGETVRDGETGFLVPSDDAAALADRVGRLAINPTLRTSLGQCGRIVAKRDYSLEASVRRIIAVYKSAIDSHAAAGTQRSHLSN